MFVVMSICGYGGIFQSYTVYYSRCGYMSVCVCVCVSLRLYWTRRQHSSKHNPERCVDRRTTVTQCPSLAQHVSLSTHFVSAAAGGGVGENEETERG